MSKLKNIKAGIIAAVCASVLALSFAVVVMPSQAWAATTFTYYANGGTFDDGSTTKTTSINSSSPTYSVSGYSAAWALPVKEGDFVFKSWNTKADGTGIVVGPRESTTVGMYNYSYKLYAQYKEDPSLTVAVSTKINADPSIKVAGETFTLTSKANKTADYDKGIMMVPGYVNINVGEAVVAEDMETSQQVITSNITLPKASEFSAPGLYQFTVSQTTSLASDKWKQQAVNGAKSFTVNLYIVNDEENGGFKYASDQPYTITGSTADKYDALEFIYNNIETRTLTVSMNIKGAYAAKTTGVGVNVTVALPDYWTDKLYQAQYGGENGFSASSAIQNTDGTFTYKGSLADGKTFKATLPVGATYSIEQTVKDGYEASGEYTYSSTYEDEGLKTLTSTVAPVEGAGTLTVSNAADVPNLSTKIGNGTDNNVVLTNTTANTPLATGLAGMGELPYIALAAALAGAAVVIFRNRRSRENA